MSKVIRSFISIVRSKTKVKLFRATALCQMGLFSFLVAHAQPLTSGKELISTELNSWRSATVFTYAIWDTLVFYGAGAGMSGGDPRHEMEIGVFHLLQPDSGYHHALNPVITREQFNLDAAGKGITPLSIVERGDSLFMFCTSRPDDDLEPQIVLISAHRKNPYQWGNYRTIVDEHLSGEKNNHGASAIVDSKNSSRLLLYFAARTAPAAYRILMAQVPLEEISNPSKYQLIRDYEEPVLRREGGKVNYPHIIYDQKMGVYELYYSSQSIDDPNRRSCFMTTSSDPYTFTISSMPMLNPAADPKRNDHAYVTGPKVYNGHLYYSGRRRSSGDYRGIFCTRLRN